MNVDTPPSKVEIIYNNGCHQLFVNKKPFYIKGAGLEFGDVELLSKNQANSFRTWRVQNGVKSGKEVLDEALKHGLMVAMGIEVGRERHGFDYDNDIDVNSQLEKIKSDIYEIKDHPALLLWVIGNELNLKYTNPKVWDAVNDISKMLHKVDPNHPTTTPLAGITEIEIDYIKQRCPDLDCISLQMYGDLDHLPALIRKFGWNGPYIVTEWGATGHWEVPKTSWGAPIEENSTLKALNFSHRYSNGIRANTNQCLGSYVFLWGQKQERTPTWYGLFTKGGKPVESVDVMKAIWGNDIYYNVAPQIQEFLLDGKTAYSDVSIKDGQLYSASVIVSGKSEQLTYEWEVLLESEELKDGGDQEQRPKKVEPQIRSQDNGRLTFFAPKKGVYRLFVYVSNDSNRIATANIPFQVL